MFVWSSADEAIASRRNRSFNSPLTPCEAERNFNATVRFSFRSTAR